MIVPTPEGGDNLDTLDAYLYRSCLERFQERARLITDSTRPLLPQCLAEGKRKPHDIDAGRECVNQAASFVDDLWMALSPTWKVTGYSGHLWIHTDELPDPKSYEDDHAITKEMVEEYAARYLSMPWLSSGYLDWIFVDALTRNEIVAFEFEVNSPKIDVLGLATPKWIERGYLGWGIEVVIAAGIVWWLAHEYEVESLYRNLWLAAAVSYYVASAIRFRVQLRKRRILLAEIAAADANLTGMIRAAKSAYYELRSPVLNPTRVRELFKSAEAKGITWSGAIWPILENAIRRHPGVWITTRQQQPGA